MRWLPRCEPVQSDQPAASAGVVPPHQAFPDSREAGSRDAAAGGSPARRRGVVPARRRCVVPARTRAATLRPGPGRAPCVRRRQRGRRRRRRLCPERRRRGPPALRTLARSGWGHPRARKPWRPWCAPVRWRRERSPAAWSLKAGRRPGWTPAAWSPKARRRPGWTPAAWSPRGVVTDGVVTDGVVPTGVLTDGTVTAGTVSWGTAEPIGGCGSMAAVPASGWATSTPSPAATIPTTTPCLVPMAAETGQPPQTCVFLQIPPERAGRGTRYGVSGPIPLRRRRRSAPAWPARRRSTACCPPPSRRTRTGATDTVARCRRSGRPPRCGA